MFYVLLKNALYFINTLRAISRIYAKLAYENINGDEENKRVNNRNGYQSPHNYLRTPTNYAVFESCNQPKSRHAQLLRTDREERYNK